MSMSSRKRPRPRAWTVKPPVVVGNGPEWARRSWWCARAAWGAPAAVTPAAAGSGAVGVSEGEHPAIATRTARTGKTARANGRVNDLMDASSDQRIRGEPPSAPEGVLARVGKAGVQWRWRVNARF